MPVERNTVREFAVFNAAKDNYHNLNYLGAFDTNNEEFEERPTSLFTYEECERYIIHKDSRSDLSILNMMQPKYLLAFSLDVIRKEYRDKLQKQYIAPANPFQEIKKNAVNMSNNSTLEFMQSLAKWDEKLNSHETQAQGKMSQVLAQKPKFEDFGLEYESFTETEKIKLKSAYNITE